MSKKVLIVDDDVDIVHALSLTLELEGYIVYSTTKGIEAFDKIDEHNPDLVLLDILMSGVDGRLICKKLKSEDKTKSIPVVMISAHPSAKETGAICGANDFLEKPFEIEEIKRIIKKYVG